MEPLSRKERNAMKKNGRGVTDAEIAEYEQLLVQRHWSRTDSETPLRHRDSRANKRIEELYQKLYNKYPGSSSNTGSRR
jgi:hypothetical protein